MVSNALRTWPPARKREMSWVSRPGDMGEYVLRRHAVDLEGIDRGLQVLGPFDQASDAGRVAVQPPPQPFDASEIAA